MNCCGRFDFGGLTVLLGWRGHQVSCYTTGGGGGDWNDRSVDRRW